MYSELAIAQHIQTQVRTLSAFETNSVTVNNDEYLDGPIGLNPFFSVYTADDFDSQQSQCPGLLRLDMLCVLVVEFTGSWEDSLNDFMTKRQLLIDLFTTDNPTAICISGGMPTIKGLRANGPIEYIRHVEGDTLPYYVRQAMVMPTEQYN